jgi:Bifunctional DNA primase/polymerase, N-terminal/Primase C terminal 2 (PriCT-2)
MEKVSLVEAALGYAVPIFPCKNIPGDEDQHKRPLTRHGFKEASTDPDTIRWWWRRWPNALIGMPTGPVSGVDVLDLDNKTNKHGVHKNGFLRVPDWQSRSPVIARTGSGGAHLYFKSDSTIRNTIDEIALGVDTRGVGGYVIVPPSAGYTWVNGHDFSNLPPWPSDLRPAERPIGVPGDNPQADPKLVAAALAVIPNDDVNWEEWNRIGMATWRATDGAQEGFIAFDAWSQKSNKYDQRDTLRRWNNYFKSPPTRLGAGTLFRLARHADLTWSDAYDNAAEAAFLEACKCSVR